MEEKIRIVAQEPKLAKDKATEVEIQADSVITVESHGTTYTMQAVKGGGLLVKKIQSSLNLITTGYDSLMIV